jgi:hypothetical protein
LLCGVAGCRSLCELAPKMVITVRGSHAACCVALPTAAYKVGEQMANNTYFEVNETLLL